MIDSFVERKLEPVLQVPAEAQAKGPGFRHIPGTWYIAGLHRPCHQVEAWKEQVEMNAHVFKSLARLKSS